MRLSILFLLAAFGLIGAVDPPPLLSSTLTPSSSLRGETSTFIITIDNSLSSVEAKFMSLLMTLPAGIEINNTPLTTCTNAWTATPTVSQFFFANGKVGPGQSCTVTAMLVAVAPGSYTVSTGTLKTNLGQTTAVHSSVSVAEAPPVFSLTTSPTILQVNTAASTFLWTMDHSEAVTTPASNLAFSMNLPLNAQVATPSNSAVNCTAGTWTAVSGSTSVDFVGGSVAVGDACTVQVDIVLTAQGPRDFTSSDLTSDLGNSGFTTASLTAIADPPPLWSLVIDPTMIVIGAGNTALLTWTLDNSASSTNATNLDFATSLPAGVIVANPPNAATTCDGTGIVSGESGSSTVSYNGGGMVVTGATCTVSIQVTGSIAGTYSVTSGALTSSNGDSGTTTFNALTVNDAPPLFSAVFNPATIVDGGTGQLVWTIDNAASTTAATSLSFTASLPTDLFLANPANGATDCVGGSVSAADGGSSMSFSGGSAAAGSSCTVSLNVTSTAVTTLGSPFSVTTGALTSGNGDSGTATAQLNVKDAPPGFSASISPTEIVAGSAGSTLTFTIDNSGSLTSASSLNFSASLPAGLVVSNPSGAVSSCTGGTIAASPGGGSVSYGSGGSVAAGGSCTVSVKVTSSSAGSFSVTSGSLASSNGDSGSASTGTLTVIDAPPLFLVDFNPDTLVDDGVGQVVWTIDNSASTTASTSLAFSTSLGPSIAIADPANLATTCGAGTVTGTAGSATMSLSGGSVSAGGTCTVSLDVTSTAVTSPGSPLTITTGVLTSSNGDSGTATDSLTVIDAPPLFSASLAPGVFVVGGTSVLTWTIDNSGASTPTDSLSFTANLPSDLVVADPSNSAVTCGGTGSVTAAPGGGTVSYSGAGSVAQGATCTVSVDVTSSTVGSYAVTSGDLTSSDGNSGQATSNTLSVVDAPPLFSGQFNPATIVDGGTGQLVWTIDNAASTTAATALAFTASLPTDLFLANPANGATDCVGGSVSAADGGSSMSFSGGSAAAGSSCTVSLDVTSTAVTTLGSPFSVTTTALTSGNGDSGTATAELSVTDKPPLFSVSLNTTEIVAGEIVVLTWTIDNTACSTMASELSFASTLPGTLIVYDPALTETTCTGGLFSATPGNSDFAFSGGSVAAGSTCTASIQVTSRSGGSFLVSSGDLTSSNGNSGSATSPDTLVATDAPPQVQVSLDPPVLEEGAASTLVWGFDNSLSTTPATDISFTMTLPPGVTLADPNNPGTSNCNGGSVSMLAGTGMILFFGGTAAPGESCTVALDVTSSQAGSYDITIGRVSSSNGGSDQTTLFSFQVSEPTASQAPSAAPTTPNGGDDDNGCRFGRFLMHKGSGSGCRERCSWIRGIYAGLLGWKNGGCD